MTTSIEIGERRRGRLSYEEIERRKAVLREYVHTHPDLTQGDILRSRTLQKAVEIYDSKTTRAIYAAITNGSSPKDVPPENFLPLVSYMVSKRRRFLKKSGIADPSVEDMKQEGMVGVLKAQQGYRGMRIFEQDVAYMHLSISRQLWKGARVFCNPISFSPSLMSRIATICRYEYSAAEARKVDFGISWPKYRDETIDRLSAIVRGKRMNLQALVSMQTSLEERREDMSAVRQDLEVFLSRLSEGYRAIMIARAEGQTLQEIGDGLGLTSQRIGQIVKKAQRSLVRYIRNLLADGNPLAQRLYREYFEK